MHKLPAISKKGSFIQKYMHIPNDDYITSNRPNSEI